MKFIQRWNCSQTIFFEISLYKGGLSCSLKSAIPKMLKLTHPNQQVLWSKILVHSIYQTNVTLHVHYSQNTLPGEHRMIPNPPPYSGVLHSAVVGLFMLLAFRAYLLWWFKSERTSTGSIVTVTLSCLRLTRLNFAGCLGWQLIVRRPMWAPMKLFTGRIVSC